MLPALLQRSLRGALSKVSTANLVDLYVLHTWRSRQTQSTFLLASFFFIDGVLNFFEINTYSLL